MLGTRPAITYNREIEGDHMLELIIAVVIGPKPAVQVPDAGTTLSLLTISVGAIALIRSKLKMK